MPSGPELSLWYNEPAEEWNEALPIGNGRLGAMVFGRTDVERIQLNEESLWCRKGAYENSDGSEALPAVEVEKIAIQKNGSIFFFIIIATYAEFLKNRIHHGGHGVHRDK